MTNVISLRNPKENSRINFYLGTKYNYFTNKVIVTSTDNINLKSDGFFFVRFMDIRFGTDFFLGDMQKLKRISPVLLLLSTGNYRALPNWGACVQKRAELWRICSILCWKVLLFCPPEHDSISSSQVSTAANSLATTLTRHQCITLSSSNSSTSPRRPTGLFMAL